MNFLWFYLGGACSLFLVSPFAYAALRKENKQRDFVLYLLITFSWVVSIPLVVFIAAGKSDNKT